MNKHLISFLLALALIQLPAPLLASGLPPPLMLANLFHANIRLADYWVSGNRRDARLLGWREVADARRRIRPCTAMVHRRLAEDTARRRAMDRARALLRTVSIVRQAQPDDAAWREVRFMLFDLPAHPGDFSERDVELGRIVAAIGQPWVQHVAQFKVNNLAELHAVLVRVVRQGGEGLALHSGASSYRAERNDDLLKLKPYQDAEAQGNRPFAGQG